MFRGTDITIFSYQILKLWFGHKVGVPIPKLWILKEGEALVNEICWGLKRFKVFNCLLVKKTEKGVLEDQILKYLSID